MSRQSQQSRQQRTVLLLLFPIIGLPFLLMFLWLPRTSNRDAVDIKTDSTTDSTKQTSEERKDSEKSDHQSTAPERSTETTEEPTPTRKSNQSTIDKMLAEQKKRRDDAISTFDQALQNVDLEKLNEFGGDDWKEIQTLRDEAMTARQPDVTVRKLQQAESLLRELRPLLPDRKAIAGVRKIQATGDPIVFLQALCSEQDRYPDAAEQFDAMWQDVTTWESSRWLEVCQAEIDTMAPDDRGFAEIWHAKADYQRALGNVPAQLEAEEKAWNSLDRMTDANRAAESALECLHRLPSTGPADRRAEASARAEKLILQISNLLRRSSLLAELSGMVGAAGHSNASQTYLDESVAVLSADGSDIVGYMPAINRCRSMSMSAQPADVLSVCATVPQFTSTGGLYSIPANTIVYSYAAVAAAKKNEQVLWWKAVLLAEAAQMDAPDYGDDNIVARATLVKADLAKSNWRRALISANNLSDPGMRASIVYKIMRQAPEAVPLDMGLEVVQLRPTDWLAAPATAKFVSHYATPETIREKLIPMVFQLKDNSTRAAVYLGLARHAAGLDATLAAEDERPPAPMPDLNNARSLLEAAESAANILQLPMERAWANVWIAACWHRLDQPASYRKACDRVQKNLFVCWQQCWLNGETGENQDLRTGTSQLAKIVECYRTLAEIQAFVLHDSRNAVETCIDTARAAESLHTLKPELRIHLRAIVEAIREDCGLPPNLMDSGIDPVNNYLRMNLMASLSDIQGVRKNLALIETEGPGYLYDEEDCLARAHAELALLSAKSGDLDSYRAARRQAMNLIQTQNATESILLLLFEGDAYAGEFELVTKGKRPDDRLPLYGTMSRPLSTLCVELSAAGRADEASPFMPSVFQRYWRIRAMHGVAAGRLLKDPDADHLAWVSSLEEPIDRVAAHCGLALRNPRLEKSLKADNPTAK